MTSLARPALTIVAWLGVCLIIFQALGAALHLAVVEHVACAEHGRIEHAIDGTGVPSAAEESPDARLSTAPPASPTDHEHEQCLFASTCERSIRTAASDIGSASASPLSYIAMRGDPVGHPPLAILREAPKTSPPVTIL